MNDFEILREKIVKQFPLAKTEFRDRAGDSDRYWFLDIIMATKDISVEWRPGKGFGFSDLSEPDSHVYGEGPDEVHENVESTFLAISKLLIAKDRL